MSERENKRERKFIRFLHFHNQSKHTKPSHEIAFPFQPPPHLSLSLSLSPNTIFTLSLFLSLGKRPKPETKLLIYLLRKIFIFIPRLYIDKKKIHGGISRGRKRQYIINEKIEKATKKKRKRRLPPLPSKTAFFNCHHARA